MAQFQPGDRSIPASFLNRVGDAADLVLNQQGGGAFGGTTDSDVILVYNSSGSDVSRFGVLALGDVRITQADNAEEFAQRVYMDGVQPAVGDHEGKFVVALEPIASGKIGRCVAGGLVQCQVTINDDAHEYATITDDSVAKLSSAASGYARIMWKAGTSGDQWAIVQLNAQPQTMFRAKITASSGASDNHSIEEIDGDDATVPNGRTSTSAKAMNGRRGIPVDTLVFVLAVEPETAGGDPRYWFTVGEGQKDTPKSLVGSGATADSTEWDVEDDSQSVQYLPARIFDDSAASGNFYFYQRQVTTDASGDSILVTAETRHTLPGDGYNETRHNDVQVDLIPNNGVIDFDDQQTPGTDEVVVQWTLTGGQDADGVAAGNDGLRTVVQGVVDVSGITAGSAGDVEVVDYMIRVDENASTGLKTLDSTDHSGMTVEVWVAQASGTTLATWQNSNGDTMTNYQNYRIGESHTSDVILATGLGSGGSRLLIDQSDGSKLKLELNGVPASTFFDFMRIRVKRGTSKATPADLDFDFNS